MNNILLDLLSIGAVFSSVLVITAKNPVVAVIFLISLFLNAAGYLILTGIGFVGISYIIVYIGAITVLFLFIIMMINIRLLDLLEIGNEYTKNFPLAFIIGCLFIYELFNILPFTANNVIIINYPLDALNLINTIFNSSIFQYSYSNIDLNTINNLLLNSIILLNPFINLNLQNFLQIEVLGLILYTYGAIWLLIISIILLLAMISTLFLSRKVNNY